MKNYLHHRHFQIQLLMKYHFHIQIYSNMLQTLKFSLNLLKVVHIYYLNMKTSQFYSLHNICLCYYHFQVLYGLFLNNNVHNIYNIHLFQYNNLILVLLGSYNFLTNLYLHDKLYINNSAYVDRFYLLFLSYLKHDHLLLQHLYINNLHNIF